MGLTQSLHIFRVSCGCVVPPRFQITGKQQPTGEIQGGADLTPPNTTLIQPPSKSVEINFKSNATAAERERTQTSTSLGWARNRLKGFWNVKK